MQRRALQKPQAIGLQRLLQLAMTVFQFAHDHELAVLQAPVTGCRQPRQMLQFFLQHGRELAGMLMQAGQGVAQQGGRHDGAPFSAPIPCP